MLGLGRLALVLTLAVSIAVAAGCGGDGDGEGGDGRATAPSLGVGSPLSWERAFAGPEDRRVRVHLTTVPCRLPVVAVGVEEGGSAVTIDVAGQKVPEDEVCVQVAARRCLLVTLTEPLGERALVDAATGKRRPVEATGGDDLPCTVNRGSSSTSTRRLSPGRTVSTSGSTRRSGRRPGT